MRAISATMLRDLVVCERRMALDLHGDPSLRDETSPFVRMLWRDGLAHEEEVLAAVAGSAVDLRGLDRQRRVTGTMDAIAMRAPVILGGVIEHGDLVGMPDVLRSTNRGVVAYDVKAGAAVDGRGAYKPEYLAQVAHYAHILAAINAGPADTAGIVGRDGSETSYDLTMRFGRDGSTGIERHAMLLATARGVRDGAVETRGALSSICGMCEWRTSCRAELTQADDLTRIAGVGRALRTDLDPIARSVGELARLPPESTTVLRGVGSARLRRLAGRARLLSNPTAGPMLLAPLDLPASTHRIDFDVEADPSRGLVYLHGFWHERNGAPGEFAHFFAETADERGERDAFAAAIAHFQLYPDAHWFHYSAYEHTAYRALQRRHPDVCAPEEIEKIFAPERCTDLYAVISRATDWPLGSYGIKSIAKACGFAWQDVDPGGAASIEWYDRYVRTGDPELRSRIVTYNRDDVLASAHVRAALDELKRTGRIDAFRRPAA